MECGGSKNVGLPSLGHSTWLPPSSVSLALEEDHCRFIETLRKPVEEAHMVRIGCFLPIDDKELRPPATIHVSEPIL